MSATHVISSCSPLRPLQLHHSTSHRSQLLHPLSSMPPPPLLHSSTTTISVVTLLLLTLSSASAHNCSSATSSHTASPCPPFSSAPPFPFSAAPGCGHPSFRVHCARPHSTITINNQRFTVLHFNPNSSSLRLSLIPTTTTASLHCSPVLRRPVNLSGTPFRVSPSSCSRLQLLRPCSDPDLPNCRHCPWACQLIQNPARILPTCGSTATRPAGSEQGCQTDVLSYLDLLLRRFGFEIEWDEEYPDDAYFPSCRRCQAANGICGFDSSDPGNPFLCFRRESTISPPWIRRYSPNLLISAVFAAVTLAALVAVAALKFRSLKLKLADDSSEDPTTLFLRRQRSASLLPPVFTYDELELATRNFDSSCKIGDGGFGSVYRAQLTDGRVVAVKHLHRQTSSSAASAAAAAWFTYFTKSFCNEILILSSIDHPNMVKLHGYCSDPRGLLLVYDYVPNGTLADHLHSHRRSTFDQTLTWQVRLDIAIQVATVIEYLHFSVKPSVVHRDITSSNIFVERDLRVKVGDFGLSRLMSGPDPGESGTGVVTTGPQGTPGYLDPDYHKSFRLTEKSDVYSFGVVLMELITGMRAVDERRERREAALADLVVVRIQMGRFREVVDPRLVSGGEVVDGVAAAAELAFRCVAADKDDRPDMAEVVAELRRISGRSYLSLEF